MSGVLRKMPSACIQAEWEIVQSSCVGLATQDVNLSGNREKAICHIADQSKYVVRGFIGDVLLRPLP